MTRHLVRNFVNCDHVSFRNIRNRYYDSKYRETGNSNGARMTRDNQQVSKRSHFPNHDDRSEQIVLVNWMNIAWPATILERAARAAHAQSSLFLRFLRTRVLITYFLFFSSWHETHKLQIFFIEFSQKVDI